MNFGYSTNLKVLSMVRCGSTSLEQDCLAVVTQTSFGCSYTLNLSILRGSFPFEPGVGSFQRNGHLRDLAIVDQHLQQAKSANFKCLNLGVPRDFIEITRDFFAQTSLKGLVNVMSVAEVDDLPYVGSEMRTIPMWRVSWRWIDDVAARQYTYARCMISSGRLYDHPALMIKCNSEEWDRRLPCRYWTGLRCLHYSFLILLSVLHTALILFLTPRTIHFGTIYLSSSQLYCTAACPSFTSPLKI